MSSRAAVADHMVFGTMLRLSEQLVAPGEVLTLGASLRPGHMGLEAQALLSGSSPPLMASSHRSALVQWFGWRLAPDDEPAMIWFADDEGGCLLSVSGGRVPRLRLEKLAFRGQAFPDLSLPFLEVGGHASVLLGAGGDSYLLLLEVKRQPED